MAEGRFTYTDQYRKLQFLYFCDDTVTCSDNGLPYISKIKQPKILLGTPTNTKKWKKVIVNTKNESTGAIPLYITVEIDDITVLSPESYYVYVNEDDDYVYYEKTLNPNEDISLKANMELGVGANLGEMILGATKLGDIKNSTFKIDVNGKGKGISVEIADNYIDDSGNMIGTNDKPFSISDIGFIYKLKKVKTD